MKRAFRAALQTTLWPVLIASLMMSPVHAQPASLSVGEPNMATNDPDQFAWHLFAAVNRPARPGAHETLWETWAEQSTVYADACVKPQWPGIDGPPFTGKRSRLVEMIREEIDNRQVAADQFNLLTGEENVQQVKVNRPFFNYVVDNDLWYQEGVIRKASTDGIDFPDAAVVFKAEWKEITEQEKESYYWRLISREAYNEALGLSGPSADGPPTVLLGLYAFHIVSKAINTWVWTTWNQEDTPGRCDYIGCRDTYGTEPSFFPPHREMGGAYPNGQLTAAARRLLDEAGLAKAFYHYRLMGTQNTFTDHTGRPTLLGNAVLEPGFGNTSSCTTCHATASLSAVGTTLPTIKSVQPLEGYVGTPDPSWFYTSPSSGVATPIVYQTDFMWQLTGTPSRSDGCGGSDDAGGSSPAAD